MAARLTVLAKGDHVRNFPPFPRCERQPGLQITGPALDSIEQPSMRGQPDLPHSALLQEPRSLSGNQVCANSRQAAFVHWCGRGPDSGKDFGVGDRPRMSRIVLRCGRSFAGVNDKSTAGSWATDAVMNIANVCVIRHTMRSAAIHGGIVARRPRTAINGGDTRRDRYDGLVRNVHHGDVMGPHC